MPAVPWQTADTTPPFFSYTCMAMACSPGFSATPYMALLPPT